MSIDPVNNTSSMLSLPRDLWVTEDSGSSHKINATYAFAKQRALYQNSKDTDAAHNAGVKVMEDMVSGIVDMPIHYYVMVDFKAFEQAINTVGGIDINVPDASTVEEWLWDESTGKNYHLNVDSGPQHFDGQRALFFSRSRHTSARGDFDRSERQRLVIQALSQKVLSAGTYSNPTKISGLLSDFGDHVSTDMSISDAVRMAAIGKKVGSKMESLDIASAENPLMTTGNINGQSVVLPRAGEGDYSALQAFVHSKMRDGYIAKENAVVDILNGAGTAGLASAQSDRLKYYGYTVGTIGDAPTMYEETVIIDLTNGKKPYTKNYLEKRYDVEAVTKLPEGIQAGNANFIIILGRDETTSSEN
jgi:LCP family protein required for cell wall assembly